MSFLQWRAIHKVRCPSWLINRDVPACLGNAALLLEAVAAQIFTATVFDDVQFLLQTLLAFFWKISAVLQVKPDGIFAEFEETAAASASIA
jgi:hypothetical protein